MTKEITPKEKAQELVLKYSGRYRVENEHGAIEFDLNGRQCVLICVDEIINSHEIWGTEQTEVFEYWEQVKNEIMKL